MNKSYSTVLLVVFGVFLIIFNYPLLISQSFREGLKEYIMIGFFVIVLLCAYLFKDSVSRENYEHFKAAFIWAAVVSSAFLMFQYTMYFGFGVKLFKINFSQYYSNIQTSCHLLMEDHSCSTIMLGCGVFYIAERITKKKWYIYIPALFLVLTAMAVTSRRTSTLTLIVAAAMYIVFHYRGFGKKLIFSVIFGAAVVVMIYYLLIVRPVHNISQVLSDNGRFENYSATISIILKNPFGIGYDNKYLFSLMTDVDIPHNTLLRWICMGGIVFSASLIYIIYSIIRTSKYKQMTSEFWAILYSVIASNFIPDILNARYFVIPCAIVFLVNMRKEEEPERVPPPGEIIPLGSPVKE